MIITDILEAMARNKTYEINQMIRDRENLIPLIPEISDEETEDVSEEIGWISSYLPLKENPLKLIALMYIKQKYPFVTRIDTMDYKKLFQSGRTVKIFKDDKFLPLTIHKEKLYHNSWDEKTPLCWKNRLGEKEVYTKNDVLSFFEADFVNRILCALQSKYGPTTEFLFLDGGEYAHFKEQKAKVLVRIWTGEEFEETVDLRNSPNAMYPILDFDSVNLSSNFSPVSWALANAQKIYDGIAQAKEKGRISFDLPLEEKDIPFMEKIIAHIEATTVYYCSPKENSININFQMEL